jgi:DNA-binding CsgD family transcriptional regulator
MFTLLTKVKALLSKVNDGSFVAGVSRCATLSDFAVAELSVGRLLARRITNKEIAEQLDLSPHTVRHHVENIFRKLGVHSRRAIREPSD